jgi:hypothetical protein
MRVADYLSWPRQCADTHAMDTLLQARAWLLTALLIGGGLVSPTALGAPAADCTTEDALADTASTPCAATLVRHCHRFGHGAPYRGSNLRHLGSVRESAHDSQCRR